MTKFSTKSVLQCTSCLIKSSRKMSLWLNLNVNCSILGDGGSERRGRETIHSSLSDTADSLCYNDCSENGHCEKGEFRTKGSLIFKLEFLTLFFQESASAGKTFMAATALSHWTKITVRCLESRLWPTMECVTSGNSRVKMSSFWERTL